MAHVKAVVLVVVKVVRINVAAVVKVDAILTVMEDVGGIVLGVLANVALLLSFYIRFNNYI